MNEATELGDTGGGDADFSSSGPMDDSSQNIMGTSDEDAFKNAGLDPAKYGIGVEDDKELSIED